MPSYEQEASALSHIRCCRVLSGSMHVLAYDWQDAELMASTVVTEPQAAVQVVDRVVEVRARAHAHAHAHAHAPHDQHAMSVCLRISHPTADLRNNADIAPL